MPQISNPKHERFCIAKAKGCDDSEAYESAGYSGKGAAASAARLLQNAKICERIAEIGATITAGVIKAEIANKDWRVLQLHDILQRLYRIRDARSADVAIKSAPGGDTGFVQVTQQSIIGPNNKRVLVLEHAVDRGLVGEIKSTLRQVAEELGQLTQKHEVGGTKDADGNPTDVPVKIVISQDEANF